MEKLFLITVALGVLLVMIFHFPLGFSLGLGDLRWSSIHTRSNGRILSFNFHSLGGP